MNHTVPIFDKTSDQEDIPPKNIGSLIDDTDEYVAISKLKLSAVLSYLLPLMGHSYKTEIPKKLILPPETQNDHVDPDVIYHAEKIAKKFQKSSQCQLLMLLNIHGGLGEEFLTALDDISKTVFFGESEYEQGEKEEKEIIEATE